jgi:hypothetical protein
MTCSCRAFPFRFRLDLPVLALLTCAFIACEVTAALALEGRLRVVPVLFIPSDNSEIDGGKVAAYRDLIRKYLALAQSYYRTQLVTDSFESADGDPLVYTARHPHSYYDDHFKVEPNAVEVNLSANKVLRNETRSCPQELVGIVGASGFLRLKGRFSNVIVNQYLETSAPGIYASG